MPFPAHDLLRCPVCAAAWDGARSSERSLVCANGHRFDAARQGYINFLTGRGTRFVPDTAAMVAARDRFLGAGHYAPIAAAFADAAAGALAPRTADGERTSGEATSGETTSGETADDDAARLGRGPRPCAVLDAGAGTGYYLSAVLARAGRQGSGSVRAVALDLSPYALRRAAKLPGTAAVVWDLWRPLPLRDSSVDVVLDVFAPRNLPEFARVLRRGGLLCVVTPLPDHLAELRGLLPLLDVPAGKSEGVVQAAAGEFDMESRQEVRFHLELGGESAADVALMGPAGHHASREEVLAGLPRGPIRATAAVELSVLRRR